MREQTSITPPAAPRRSASPGHQCRGSGSTFSGLAHTSDVCSGRKKISPGANHEVILSYLTWKRRFGGDPGIVGRTLLLNQESYQVIGVAAPDFNWPNQAELWVPLALPTSKYFDNKNRYNEFLFSVARLRPEVTNSQANSYLALRSSQNIAAEGPNSFGQSLRLGHVLHAAGRVRCWRFAQATILFFWPRSCPFC